MRDVLGEAGLEWEDTRSIATVEEKHRKYTLKNPCGATILKYRVDGGLIPREAPGRKCDFALGLTDSRQLLLIELKGSGLNDAAEQISGALDWLKANGRLLSNMRYHARIVSSGFGEREKLHAAVKNLKKEIRRPGGTVEMRSRQLTEDLRGDGTLLP